MACGRVRTLVLFAAGAALAATLALPAAPAGAAGEQLAASPATNLLNGDTIQVNLTSASAYNGQTVQFAECGQPTTDWHANGDSWRCGTLSPRSGATVSGGSVSGTVTAVYGQIGVPDAGISCTQATNGTCTVEALAVSSGQATTIATYPITFAAAPTTTMTVSPSTNLGDSTPVSVNVTGIPNGVSSSLEITQCHYSGDIATVTYHNVTCRYGTAAPVSNHALSTSYTAFYGPVYPGNDAVGSCDETAMGTCLIAALDRSNEKLVAVKAISFAKPANNFTVTPHDQLAPNQQIQVSGSGIPSKYGNLTVIECNTKYATDQGATDFYTDTVFNAACWGFGLTDYVTPSNGAFSTTLDVVSGPANSDSNHQICDSSTNGECAIVLVGSDTQNAAYQPGRPVIASQPVTFRPPATALAKISASPTTGLYAQAPGTVSLQSGSLVPDGNPYAELAQCNIAAVKAHSSGNWFVGCSPLVSIKVANNTFAPTKFAYHEGTVGGTPNGFPCDPLAPSHACAIVLVGADNYSNPPVLSNAIAISFRDPNSLGKPIFTVSPNQGLSKGDWITVTVKNVPDLLGYLLFEQCPVKAGFGSNKCVGLTVRPGDGGVWARSNAAQAKMKVVKPGKWVIAAYDAHNGGFAGQSGPITVNP